MSDPHLTPALQRPQRGANTAMALHRPYQLQVGTDNVGGDEAASSALTLTDLLRIVLKHKWTLLAVLLVAGSVSVVRTLLSTPVYRSTLTLQIEKSAPRVVNFNNDLDQEPYSDEFTLLKTQYELLRSRSLAERVVDELRLERPKATAPAKVGQPTDAKPAAQSTGYIDRIVGGYRKLTMPANADSEVLSREGVIGGFLGSLTIEPVRNSRLVRVHVDNTNPALAAQIANATAQAFIAMGLERRMEASTYAKTFLEDQIKQVKAKLEESERKLNQYAQTRQILTLDDKTNVVNQTYTDYATALARAEQERIKAEAAFAEIKRSPDAAQQVMESKPIQNYKEVKAKLEIEYQQNLGIYKPDFPKMVQLKGQIDKADSQIKAEIAAVSAAVQSQYEAAQRQESLLRSKLGETRKQVLSTQDSSIDLNLLKREVDTNRQLYDGLLQRLKQIGVSGDITANNISVVDRAEPPLFPYKPDLQRNLMFGLAVGLVLGLCMVFLLEYLDDSFKFPDEIERTLGVALMGIVPMISQRRDQDKTSIAFEVHTQPRSPIAEAYRSLRTSLQFSTSEGAPRRLLITSTTRDEGKSTSALALAINFAQMGQRVLLIDADMRNPSVHKQLGIPNESGLSNLLSGDYGAATLITQTTVPFLSVMTAGPIPPNPVDLLLGPKLAAVLDQATAHGIHYVIVDAPPLLGIADSIVLGNQIQNILFVVHAGSTRKSQVRDALRRLRLAGLVPRGVVLTQVQRNVSHQHYESYYGYGAVEKGSTRESRRSAKSATQG
ncbi:polysaccharide biosynthesis tyrosine autokinase [Ramlibacter sp. WS9]|uniref:GumC family protein n=1 Tax=Ramlibacter sp. WS9 TaxID=1882741 RepID=UPI001142532F|nr:polysaccharide biosynthesis tyrosine autokinase [Ramlibacter sp. WS9]ROZ66346.1 polysaccharide biosynthesis tyrosine autokinase [Ramlibacter sp. WS9]